MHSKSSWLSRRRICAKVFRGSRNLHCNIVQWDKFSIYLFNGEVEIDNNLVENAIRPTKLGAKNYLFFGSAEAGVHNALLYTLIANSKAHGLDPAQYLAEAIKRLPAEHAAALTPARIAAEQAKSETTDGNVGAAA